MENVRLVCVLRRLTMSDEISTVLEHDIEVEDLKDLLDECRTIVQEKCGVLGPKNRLGDTSYLSMSTYKEYQLNKSYRIGRDSPSYQRDSE